MSMRGLLLVNIGTPESPSVGDVRRYLAQFLDDPRVIDIHPVARKLLLHAVILPFRPRKSAAAYQKIWMPQGSPLRVYAQALARGLEDRLGQEWKVVVGMRYGTPSLATALDDLVNAGIDDILVFPLYPHYASSSTGSSLEALYALAGERAVPPALASIRDYYVHPGFIGALAAIARPVLDDFGADKVLFSYHGLPERQIKYTDFSSESAPHCFASESCCDTIGSANRACYRAQCMATSRALAESLGLSADDWTVAFQSRLGRTPWIRPYTDLVLTELAEAGVRRLAVMCPSFTNDCLETLEEIGIRGREDFIAAGGEDLKLVPCVNDHPVWIDTVADMARERMGLQT